MSDSRTFSLRAYPLCWPEGWKRTASFQRTGGNFGKQVSRGSYSSKQRLTVAQATDRVLKELGRMGVSENDVVISTNLNLRLDGFPRSDQANPSDPGAAVYWRKNRKSATKCLAIDRYARVENNLAAIAATLEAMRAIERHGGAEILDRTFQGFNALPAQAGSAWRETLGFKEIEAVSIAQLETRFRELAKVHHPDAGGSADNFQAIVDARAAAVAELKA
jgi:hypothetical protein